MNSGHPIVVTPFHSCCLTQSEHHFRIQFVNHFPVRKSNFRLLLKSLCHCVLGRSWHMLVYVAGKKKNQPCHKRFSAQELNCSTTSQERRCRWASTKASFNNWGRASNPRKKQHHQWNCTAENKPRTAGFPIDASQSKASCDRSGRFWFCL